MKKIALMFGSTLTFILLAELAVRALGLGPTRFREPRHLETADKRVGVDLYPDNPRGEFELDLRDDAVLLRYEEAGLDLHEHVERTPHAVDLRYSEELCRGDEVRPASEGVTRVVVVGDSFAEGQGVPESLTSAAQLQRRLGAAHEVLNCGRRGFDVSDVHQFVEERWSLAPDVLLYAYTLNDPEQSEEFAAQQTYLDDWILDRRRMVREGDGGLGFFESHLWAAVEERAQTASVGQATTAWYQGMVRPENDAGWSETLAHIDAMHRAMQERGGAFVVIVQPLLVELDAEYPFAAVHATVVRDLSARGIRVVDALPAFEGLDAQTLWVHPADRHPNSVAQGIVADVMHEAITAEGA